MMNFLKKYTEKPIHTNIEDFNTNIVNHYNKNEYTTMDNTYGRVGWSSERGQIERFRILLSVGVEGGDSILDYGCGLGDLYRYIKDRGYNIKYTGVDINDGFIKECIEKIGDNFKKINSYRDLTKRYDWLVASGVFTVHTSTKYLYDTIDYLYNISNKGVSFNLMNSSKSGYENEKTFTSNEVPIRGYPIRETYKYFKTKYKDVELIEVDTYKLPVELKSYYKKFVQEYNLYIYK